MITRPKPLYRLPAAERRRAALAHLGRHVDIKVDPCRDGDLTAMTGLVLSVASPAAGTVADLLILRRGPGALGDIAVSLATVHSITIGAAR